MDKSIQRIFLENEAVVVIHKGSGKEEDPSSVIFLPDYDLQTNISC